MLTGKCCHVATNQFMKTYTEFGDYATSRNLSTSSCYIRGTDSKTEILYVKVGTVDIKGMF